MNKHVWGIIAGLLAYSVALIGAEPAKTNNPAEPPAKKASASPADQAFAAAQQAMKKSDFPAGRRLLGDFAGKFPADARVPEAQFLKGMCELKGGPQGAALSTWNALIQLQPKSDAAAMALEQMILYYEKEGPPARVEELLNRLLTTFPPMRRLCVCGPNAGRPCSRPRNTKRRCRLGKPLGRNSPVRPGRN